MRIGHGFDAHRFAPGRTLILGGMRIPFDYGLAAHSDGDVLIHALCDALIGALGAGDMGRHFPDSGDQYKGIDSRILLRQVMSRVRAQGFGITNADLTLIAQAPKMAPYIEGMQSNLAADLGIEATRVNVKATTTEGMGFTGRGEGIAAHAVVLLQA
jgi:2-C-methyl-D-erythritol 2,4-cyclodiphosphate synthase